MIYESLTGTRPINTHSHVQTINIFDFERRLELQTTAICTCCGKLGPHWVLYSYDSVPDYTRLELDTKSYSQAFKHSHSKICKSLSMHIYLIMQILKEI